MVIKPMIRNNICLNSHPKGCAKVVRDLIVYTQKNMAGAGKPAPQGAPKLALIIGCSTGYGLASRIGAAFGYGAATVGISFEKAGSATKPGTPGWYNNMAFDLEAKNAGLVSKTLDGDAFSDEMKAQAIAAVKETAAAAGIEPKIDLIIYSLASPVRTDPRDGVMYRSVIKPIGKAYSGQTIDMLTGKISTATAEPATEEEIANTIKVMGGEDWEIWMDKLGEAGVLAPAVRTVAYTYIGPELSWSIYKNGTIGRAKEDLERAAKAIDAKLSKTGGAAWISVNKALVTRASAVIPIIPFYISCLFKVMKEMNLHEGCIEQLIRLYTQRLYNPESLTDSKKVPVDSEGRIRIDDWEMRDDVQKKTAERMAEITEANIYEKSDIAGFKHDFLEAHGFDVPGIDYDADVDPSTI
ncbi:enoyl-ACP reductase FabV [Breznakiella homolactica]|uniref:Trans-2-enoyl-CoA reductase [NADH] n=1 Tax=Breznakiella homolactica TaxID=2798577 RepID=A0A7T8BD94_9SPIR|nr:enoyl-ACP reductase FabV [Breznakiella homolactica]QQO11013.1 trans-2-enoyl-CoA reductase family protein [Breznakiella homolactica]